MDIGRGDESVADSFGGGERRWPVEDADELLEALEWEKRVILLSAPGPDHEAYRTTLSRLADRREGGEERRLVVFRLFDEGTSRLGSQELPDSTVEALRERYEIEGGTSTSHFVLVGLDGTAKMRREGVVSVDEIFTTIDAMPIRRREMRRQDD